MNFLCPACRTPLPRGPAASVVPCAQCGAEIDLTRVETAPGMARLWPDVDLSSEKLGRYQLLRPLASGGMGIVYEAEGPSGPCAVKVLSALLAAEPELRRRFGREAAALRTLQSPGIVRVLEEGEERGFCWYAMERVHGADLRSRIERGALPAGEVERLAKALLATLGTGHEKGFVHRDIKPANILLAPDGPKLCDFGIARLDGSSTLTESAAVLGSLKYMAPEQRRGKTSPQSDLYSLGMVLYEALAQGVPGEAELPPGVPKRLRTLMARLLAERPADRPSNAQVALELLKAPSRLKWGAAGASIVVALAAIAIGGYLAVRRPAFFNKAPPAIESGQRGESKVSRPNVSKESAPRASALPGAEPRALDETASTTETPPEPVKRTLDLKGAAGGKPAAE